MACPKPTYEPTLKVIARTENPERSREAKSCAGAYQYKYNGFEYQDELGLGWYDYGARNYDPALGRWMNIDPLAGKWNSYSPYNYTLNNPVNFIDPNGEDVYMYFFVKSKKEEDNSMFWNAALTHALDLLNV